MLPVILFDRDESSRARTLECIAECIRQHSRQMRLSLQTNSCEEVQRFLATEPGIVTLVSEITRDDLERQSGGAGLIRKAAEQNRDNYIVCCLRPGASLEKCLGVCMRPAGLLAAPPDPRKLRSLLDRILADYESVSNCPGCQHLVLHTGSSSYRLPLSHVLYIEAVDKKLNIWTRRQCISVYEALRDLEERVGHALIRCHRSYLINRDAIAQVDYSHMEILLVGGERIPLSRSYRDALRSALDVKEGDNRAYSASSVSL